MQATILNGKNVRDERVQGLIVKVANYTEKPVLMIVSIGADSRSLSYIQQKRLFGEKIGVDVRRLELDAHISGEGAVNAIEELNKDANIHGIIVQLPLPAHLNAQALCGAIDPKKDVDGLNPENVGLLSQKTPRFVPATAKGIMTLLDYYHVELNGAHAVIVNRSNLVGKPLAQLLLARNATVTIAHSSTQNIAEILRSADIIITAVGVPNFLSSGMVKAGVAIVDVGITKVSEGDKTHLVGDCNFDELLTVASYISPVPGGVGPMTVLSLFENVLDAYEHRS